MPNFHPSWSAEMSDAHAWLAVRPGAAAAVPAKLSRPASFLDDDSDRLRRALDRIAAPFRSRLRAAEEARAARNREAWFGSGEALVGARDGVSGGDAAPTRDRFVPTGDGFVPTGHRFVPTGQRFVPASDGVVPAANPFVPTGNLFARSGDQLVRSGGHVAPTSDRAARMADQDVALHDADAGPADRRAEAWREFRANARWIAKPTAPTAPWLAAPEAVTRKHVSRLTAALLAALPIAWMLVGESPGELLFTVGGVGVAAMVGWICWYWPEEA
jgi:hypothetical protein